MDITPILTHAATVVTSLGAAYLIFRKDRAKIAADRDAASEATRTDYNKNVLRMASEQLEERIDELHQQVASFRCEVAQLRAENEALRTTVAELQRVNAELCARIDALLGQLRGTE